MIGWGLLAALALQSGSPAPPSVPAPAAPSFPLTMPADLVTGFIGAQQALTDLSDCAAGGTVISPARLTGLDQKLQRLDQRARAVWGPPTQVLLASAAAAGPASCANRSPQTMLVDADARLNQLAARMELMFQPLKKGAWLGALPLCANGSPRVSQQVDGYSGDVTLVLTLSPATGAALAEWTRRQMGSSLALRLDGRILLEPTINEAIVTGQVYLSGMNPMTVDTIAAQLARCKN